MTEGLRAIRADFPKALQACNSLCGNTPHAPRLSPGNVGEAPTPSLRGDKAMKKTTVAAVLALVMPILIHSAQAAPSGNSQKFAKMAALATCLKLSRVNSR